MATRAAVREYLPIVATAGIIVAAGVAALVVAESELFRAFGPGLAVTVLVGLLVAVVLIPAMLAILGRWAFWPYGLDAAPDAGRAALSPAAVDPKHEVIPPPTRVVRLIQHRWVAAVLTTVVIFVLVVASMPLLGIRGAVSPVKSLPADNPVRQATMAAAAGFSPGILSPTGLIVSGPGITDRPAALASLAGQLQRQPGVDIVLSAADQALVSRLLGRTPPDLVGLFLAPLRREEIPPGSHGHLTLIRQSPSGIPLQRLRSPRRSSRNMRRASELTTFPGVA
ncbi:MAG TPA: MMPL family transporter [Pseudonocardiaceae bacterium]|nr:MMPL family transporter [Pseudonocardiaceae bacterium]